MTPAVLSEWATMQRVAETGCNLSRFGRCECKIALGRPGLAQGADRILAFRLRDILKAPAEQTTSNTLACLPRVFDAMPPGKEKVYGEFTEPAVIAELFAAEKEFGSTFVSRPDAWIGDMDEDAYWQLVRGIWQDRPVLLVAGSGKGRRAAGSFLANASSVDMLDAPPRDAWSAYAEILSDCLAWAKAKSSPLVYAALGATAAVLAWDLEQHGVQCLDLGHMCQGWARRGERLAA